MLQRAALSLLLTSILTFTPALAAGPKKKPTPPPTPAPPTTKVAPAVPAEAPSASPRENRLTLVQAAALAELPLRCIDRPYPYKPDRVLMDAKSVREPKLDHPAFFGCFDWHSSVHGHWMLLRLARLFPGTELEKKTKNALAPHFTAEALAGETAFLKQAGQNLFERPYGWGWVLRLAHELRLSQDPQIKEWQANFAPLEQLIAERLKDYLPKLGTPIRTGVHSNTALALGMALDYAREAENDALAQAIVQRTRVFYGPDLQCPVAYEPSGEDFLSPCLTEADLMRRVMPTREFSDWFNHFLPGMASMDADNLSMPALPADATDGKIVHLDGLNLSRAWALRGLAWVLPAGDPRTNYITELAEIHEEAGLARVASGNYEGDHWLASFAVYAMTGAGMDAPKPTVHPAAPTTTAPTVPKKR